MRRRDVPFWINESKIGWPDEFAEIKPDRTTRDEKALNRTQSKKHPAGTLMVAFPPDCQQTHADSHDKKRNDLAQTPLVNRLFLRPENQKQRRRQNTGRCLSRQRQRVKN